MKRDLSITNLSTQKGEIITTVQELSGIEDAEKILTFKLISTAGTVPEALEIIEKIHTSDVDLYTESSGELSPAGLLLACAGKPKNRKAHYSTIFRIKETTEEGKKIKTVDPYFSCMVETLGGLGARKGEFSEMYRTQSFITAIDAKRLKIIDSAGLVQSKYKKAKVQEEATEKEVIAEQAT